MQFEEMHLSQLIFPNIMYRTMWSIVLKTKKSDQKSLKLKSYNKLNEGEWNHGVIGTQKTIQAKTYLREARFSPAGMWDHANVGFLSTVLKMWKLPHSGLFQICGIYMNFWGCNLDGGLWMSWHSNLAVCLIIECQDSFSHLNVLFWILAQIFLGNQLSDACTILIQVNKRKYTCNAEY